MIKGHEILRAFVVASRLARFDLAAAGGLPRDLAAAWSSFRALGLAIPLMIYASWPTAPEFFTRTGLTPLTLSLIMTLQMLLSLLGFYLLLAVMARRLGFVRRVPHYICVQNWCALPVTTLLVLVYGGLRLSAPVVLESEWFEPLLRGLLLMFSWVITTATLHLKPVPAFVLCLIELFLSRFIQQGTDVIIALTLISQQAGAAP